MPTKIRVSRLDCAGCVDPFFVWTEYDENVLNLKASDGEKTWHGTLCKEELEELAEESKMPVAEYIQESLKALTRDHLGELTFVYTAEFSTHGQLHLTWKKQLSGGVKFKLGSIDMSPCVPQATNFLILNYCVDSTQSLVQKVDELSRECERLASERRGALDELQKCASLKDNIEKDLYSKFKLILNEKKGKIRKFMELRGHLSHQNEEMQRLVWNSKTTTLPISAADFMDRKGSTEGSAEGQQVEQQVDMATIDHPSDPVPKPESTVKSLLHDARSNRPPSPPPVKKQRVATTRVATTREGVLVPHPPPLTSSNVMLRPNENSNIDERESDMSSMDPNELLDMI